MKMYKELNRLATFAEWKGNASVGPIQLARNGFYYSRSSDEIVCFSCDVRISGCNEQHNPVEQHRLLSPNCALNTGTETRNIPLARLIRESPPQEASERNISVSCNSMHNVLRSALNRANAREHPSSINSTCRIDRSNPDCVQLRNETERLSTFHDWPSTAHPSPLALAREGFFYTGVEDRAQCAFCLGCLKRWQSADEPSHEHSKHYPACPFVRGLDVGNVPASSAVGSTVTLAAGDQGLLTRSEVLNSETVERSQTSRQAQEPRLTDQGILGSSQCANELVDLEARMSTAAVRAVLAMGFSRDLVKRTIENKLSMTGTDFQNAESLLDAIFLARETTNYHNDRSVPTASSSSSSPSSSLFSSSQAASAASVASAALAILSSSSAVSSAEASVTSRSVDAIVTTASSTATGLTSLMSRRSWRDSGIISFSSSVASLPSTCSSLQLPFVNSAALSTSPSLATTSVPSERHALAPVKPVSFSASAATTMPTITEVGTSCPTKFKAKRKRNNKKPISSKTSSNKDLEQNSSTNRKDDEESAGREVGKEAEIGLEQEREAESATGALVDDESLKYIEENRQLREARTCKVCMDSEVDTVFLPCGHLVCCRSCSPQLRNCPICRTFIRGTVKTSLS